MLYISQELQRIATEQGVLYHRVISLDDLNIKVHYDNSPDLSISYVGFGDTQNYFEGAEPLTSVEVEIYLLQKTPTTDELAPDIDLLLVDAANMAGVIVHDLITARDTLDYTLTPVQALDDLFVGYKLTAKFILNGNDCN